MASLELRRPVPLTPIEQGRLPPAVEAVSGQGDLRARVSAPEAPGDLVGLAVILARAVPDAAVTWVETALSAPSPEQRGGAGAGGPSGSDPGGSGPRSTSDDPWVCLNEGDVDRAVELLTGHELDSDGRDVVRRLLRTTNPEKLAAGCRIAQATSWRSSVSAIRRLLTHGDARVKVAAIDAVGALAGPGLVPTLQRLQGDPSPRVQQAAVAAVARIEGDDV